MTLQIWIALATANFFACLAPGQNAALMGAVAARSGPYCTGMAMFGILLAELAWATIAIYLTFGARDLAGDTFVVLQMASAAVLIWFGISALRNTFSKTEASVAVQRGGLGHLACGAVVGFANPLALVFALSVIPAFVPAGASGPGAAFFFISAVVISSAAGLFPYLVAGGLLRRAGQAKLMQLISGGALAGSGALLLIHVAV